MRIQQVIAPSKNDHMVEIGPGMGVLTEVLLPCVRQLDVIELDRDLIPGLEKNYLPIGNMTIHNIDALKFDYCALANNKPLLRVVGNLPYNISTPLLFHLLQHVKCIIDMHFMLQKEVVDRFVAVPNTKAYGKLSVIMQYWCRAEKLFDVSSSAFSPPPKVESSVVRLVPYQSPPVQLKSYHCFEELVTMSFAQRRKTLRNNLKNKLKQSGLSDTGIDLTRRAESLTLEEFAQLANRLCD